MDETRDRRVRPRKIVGALAAGAVAFAGGRVSASDAAAQPLPVAAAATSTAGGDDTLTQIIEDATASIVSVQTVSYSGPFGSQASSSGSGVVIRADGIVLTNAHVVEGATEVSVTAADGARLDAAVVGSDPGHDLAILKVDGAGLTPVTIGGSGDLRLGDTVVALGYPLGLGTTATKGIVSGLDRTIQVGDGPFGANELRGLLQTDAAINPGNSGGALLDSAGHLVGINTAAASAASAENVGFAVAIDEALPIVRDLLQDV
ncbi:MAG TPA: trypsin-like peptidase domain-containing protein [Actinomycetota bacterium]|nr:trypsin-like peptidase domain-containing protein [Actinomycetota bacterium]